MLRTSRRLQLTETGERFVDQYFRDLEALVDHFVPPGVPLSFVGHSWGAMYATWYIHAHGDRVQSAVLVEPGGFTRADVDAYQAALIATSPFRRRWATACGPDACSRPTITHALTSTRLPCISRSRIRWA